MLFHILVKLYLIKTIKSHQTDGLGAIIKKLSVKDKVLELSKGKRKSTMFNYSWSISGDS